VDERVFVPGYHQRLDRGFGREKQLRGPSPSLSRLSSPGVGVRWEGLRFCGVPAKGCQAEGCVRLAPMKQVPFQSRKHSPGLEKPWIWHPVLSLTSRVALSKWFHFPITQFSHLQNPSEFCSPRWGVQNCPEVTCELGAGKHPALP